MTIKEFLDRYDNKELFTESELEDLWWGDLLDVEIAVVGKEEYAVGFRLTDSELVASVDKALEDLKADGTYKDIYSKWFSE